jgi:pimeloyl-ACP methyl ester carboxylesterase
MLIVEKPLTCLDQTSAWVVDGLQLRAFGAAGAHATRNCLLIHGYADGAYVWDRCLPAVDHSWAAFTLDLRGHGDSVWAANGCYEIDRHFADVSKIMDEIESEPLVLVGHSLGAHIAMHIAAEQPARVSALVLVDFGPELPQGMEQAHRNLLESFQWYESRESYASWLRERRPLLEESMVQHIADSSLRKSEGGYRLKVDPALARVENDYVYDPQSLWQMLGQVRCPTLIVRGTASAYLTPAVAQKMRQTVRGPSRLSTIPAAGHAVMTDNPRAFAQSVGAFLRATVQGSR